MVLQRSLRFQLVAPCDCQSTGISMLTDVMGRSKPCSSTALATFMRYEWPRGSPAAGVDAVAGAGAFAAVTGAAWLGCGWDPAGCCAAAGACAAFGSPAS